MLRDIIVVCRELVSRADNERQNAAVTPLYAANAVNSGFSANIL